MFAVKTLFHNDLEQPSINHTQQSSNLYNRDSQQFRNSFNCIFLSCLVIRENIPFLISPFIEVATGGGGGEFGTCMNFKISCVMVSSILLWPLSEIE